MDTTFLNHIAAAKGTRLHNFAAEAIELGIQQKRTTKTLNMYINDAIGYRLTPEQVLYYSDNCFGTADAIGLKGDLLRISDLKTGVSPVSFVQLEIYVALFCLEYDFKPGQLKTELRIYQNDEVMMHVPELEQIVHIMDKIITFDRRIDALKSEAL